MRFVAATAVGAADPVQIQISRADPVAVIISRGLSLRPASAPCFVDLEAAVDGHLLLNWKFEVKLARMYFEFNIDADW